MSAPWLRPARAASYSALRGLAMIARTPLASAAVACAIAASLVAIGVVRLASHNLSGAAGDAAHGPSLVVYLEHGAESARADAIAGALSELEGTSFVNVVTPEQAKARLELTSNRATLVDLDATFFPMTIEVGLVTGVRDAAALHPFVEKLQRIDAVETVDVLGSALDRAAYLLGSIRTATSVLSLFLSGCAIFVVVVLIRSSSERSMDQRRLLERLGASPAFVLAPDIIAGLLRGLAGGLLSVVALYLFFLFAAPKASAAIGLALGGAELGFLPFSEIAVLALAGGLLGALGSALADRGSRAG